MDTQASPPLVGVLEMTPSKHPAIPGASSVSDHSPLHSPPNSSTVEPRYSRFTVTGIMAWAEQEGQTYVFQFDDQAVEWAVQPCGTVVIGVDSVRIAERLEGATPLPIGDDLV